MGLIILISLIILTGIIIASHFYSGWWIERLIGKRHKDIQTIYETGKMPEHWANPEKNMISLMNYVRKSKLMVDEDTREEVYESLESALTAWRGEDENKNKDKDS